MKTTDKVYLVVTGNKIVDTHIYYDRPMVDDDEFVISLMTESDEAVASILARGRMMITPLSEEDDASESESEYDLVPAFNFKFPNIGAVRYRGRY